MVKAVPRIVADGRAQFVSSLDRSLPIRLSLVLRMRNGRELRDRVAAVTDPRSPEYRHFASFDELASRYAPSDESADQIVRWASAAGFRIAHRNKANYVLVVDGTVGTVERALGVRLGQYNWNGRRFFSNDREPSVPGSIAPLLDDILGLNGLSVLHNIGSTRPPQDERVPRAPPGPFRREATTQANAVRQPDIVPTLGFYEPPDIASPFAYDFNALQPLSHCCNPGNDPGGSPKETSIAVVISDMPALSDIAGFANRYGLADNFTNIQLDGPSCCDDEATFDVEWATAMANSFGSYLDTSHVYEYSFGGKTSNDFYDGWAEALSDDRARVLSISFGGPEDQYVDVLGATAGISDFANLTLSMALTGWSVAVASGDDGAYTDCSNGRVKKFVSLPLAFS